MAASAVTVFLATYNRLETLSATVESYQRFTTPYELVIVDNGTDHPRCLELLAEIEKQPDVRKVYRLPKIDSMPALTHNFNVAVYDQYRKRGRKGWFAITDADICFNGTSKDALDAYVELAKATGNAVGPHTRVDSGIAIGYPLRSRVLATESRLLYRSSMRWFDDIPYSPWPIDTTFHLFPRTHEFTRLKMNTVRCGPPYDAMHLDWYVDAAAPTEENWIYLNDRGSRGVGSWGGSWIRGFWRWYQRDPMLAVDMLRKRYQDTGDLNNNAFMLAWAFQYGLPEPDLDESRRWLNAAIPPGTPWLEHRDDWLQMIYDDDFSSLGWEAECPASA